MTDKPITKTKSRLGRGLSSLLNVTEAPVQIELTSPAEPAKPAGSGETAVAESAPVGDARKTVSSDSSGETRQGSTEIPLGDIVPNPHQPRRQWDDQSIADLAASIRSTGLIQPIIVRQVDGGYQLIAGERRYRAAKRAGLTTIPAIVRDVDAFTQAQMALVENIQRQDLNPIERAQAYKNLLSQLGLTQQELASRLGEERSSVANYLRLLDLAESVRELVREGQLSLGHAKLLAGTPDILEQERLAKLVLMQGLSVRNLERLIQQGPSTAVEPRGPVTPSAHLNDLEKNIARQLGMRVQVRAAAKKGKGKLIIHYSSLDQFDGLLQKLGVSAD